MCISEDFSHGFSGAVARSCWGSSVRPGAPAAAEPRAVAAAEGQSGAVLQLAQG